MPTSSPPPYREPASRPPYNHEPPPSGASPVPSLAPAIKYSLIALAIVPLNFFVYILATGIPYGIVLFYLLAMAQLACGFAAAGLAFVYACGDRVSGTDRLAALVVAGFGTLVASGGPLGIWLAAAAKTVDLSGGAWGRPLRVRGRILHPTLREGSDWAAGAAPDVSGLDLPTRAALEALWLHDAQKEHASVPAFARISWFLAAVGAPSDLVAWSHRAALEEVDHARRCFALAAGYGERAHTVEAMPDLLAGGLDVKGDPLVHMAVESLNDGCLLEDFNADVASACAVACEDRAVLGVLTRIAREERSHAELSWRMLEWLAVRGGAPVASAIEKACETLETVPRPTAVSRGKEALVAQADHAKMRAHGRIGDDEWALLWGERVRATRGRAAAIAQVVKRDGRHDKGVASRPLAPRAPAA